MTFVIFQKLMTVSVFPVEMVQHVMMGPATTLVFVSVVIQAITVKWV